MKVNNLVYGIKLETVKLYCEQQAFLRDLFFRRFCERQLIIVIRNALKFSISSTILKGVEIQMNFKITLIMTCQLKKYI